MFSGVDNIPENSGYFTIVIVKTKDEPVHNSSRFFENRACAYYPCHRDIEQINCMFCYCPMYEWSIVREHRSTKRQMAENLRFVPTARIPIRQNIMMPL